MFRAGVKTTRSLRTHVQKRRSKKQDAILHRRKTQRISGQQPKNHFFIKCPPKSEVRARFPDMFTKSCYFNAFHNIQSKSKHTQISNIRQWQNKGLCREFKTRKLKIVINITLLSQHYNFILASSSLVYYEEYTPGVRLQCLHST